MLPELDAVPLSKQRHEVGVHPLEDCAKAGTAACPLVRGEPLKRLRQARELLSADQPLERGERPGLLQEDLTISPARVALGFVDERGFLRQANVATPLPEKIEEAVPDSLENIGSRELGCRPVAAAPDLVDPLEDRLKGVLSVFSGEVEPPRHSPADSLERPELRGLEGIVGFARHHVRFYPCSRRARSIALLGRSRLASHAVEWRALKNGTVIARIESLARRIARARSRQKVSAADLLSALWALSRESEHTAVLAPHLPQDQSWVPAGAAELVEAARALDEGAAFPPLDLAALALVARLTRDEPPVERLVSELLALGRPSTWLTASTLREHHERSQRLEQAVRAAALGRRTAIATLAEGYFEALVAPPARGPRGLFTLVGPSGVGKTYLAETLARALAEVEEETLPCLQLDMAAYGSPQGAEPLLGVAPFYGGSKPGTLTGFVHKNPRCVVLFDGLERAHGRTLEALLPLFDEGSVFDLSLEESVSFREAWVICTATIDAERLASANRTGVLASIGASPTALLDTLIPRQEAQPSAPESGGAAGIPSALISRLAKGATVLCGPLEADELATLARQSLAALGPPIEIGDDALVLFLLSLLPEVDARRVASRARAWGLDLLRRALVDGAVEGAGGSDASIRLGIDPGSDAVEFLSKLRGRQGLRLLLVDDGDSVDRRLRSEIPSGSLQIERVASADEARERLRRETFDLVLLDLTIHVEPNSSDIERGLEILEAIRTLRPELPVHLFSEEPSERGAFEEIVDRVLRRGGARSFIPCQRGADKQPDATFVGAAMAAIERRRNEKIVRDLERRRRTVTFGVRFRKGASEGSLLAEITKPRKEHLLEPPPSGSPVEYLGIPTTTFADVVGLRRAKERLQQAVRWLQDPALLGSGGSRPPRGFLLAGRPGTGKTLLARALAGETQTPLVALSAGALQSRWSGESEARVRELFAKAQRHAPTIILIDEIDSVARRRDAGAHESHGLLNQLLSSIDGVRPWEVPILVLGATNLPEQVDPALTRPGRLEETLQIDLPNAAARRALLECRLPNGSIEADVDLGKLAAETVGCTPAELDRIAREASYRRLAEKRGAVSAADLDHARRLVLVGLRADDGDLPEEERRLAAFHEAGHVVAFRELFPDRPIDFVSILPSEQGAVGAMLPSRRRERSPAAEDVRKELTVLLAGRASEAASDLPAPTAAAASDLERATNLAYRAVAEWGFDETIGPVRLDRSMAPEALWNDVWIRVHDWLAEADARARRLVEGQQAPLRALAERLVIEESLSSDAIREIVEQGAPDGRG